MSSLTVLGRLFQVVQVARPLRLVNVVIADITACLLGGFRDDATVHRLIMECSDLQLKMDYQHESGFELLPLRDVDYHPNTSDRITWGSFDTGRLRFVPATRSSIESLQKVRLDSLGEATIKQNPTCSICKDEFAQEGRVDQLIFRLPCAHCYHVHCIVQWPEVNHVCPLCRYAMPTVEEGEPSSS
ncbi:PREDICTED: E3 ubiquitin ligase BIG BROTHER-related-like [Fragaria vesca subsp. vesca]|uniref:E3 ubiquitin ligase BIG BROTHER-related-like n=1 Tax=Fragaria vesca subsp. vesca TaxID=101020 RepID=UPI0002C30A02|nr:PREDICTED: E3 ubiquitin ligase BIG BROTHER-related-like [Fragaria vesca subsp. vesca]